MYQELCSMGIRSPGGIRSLLKRLRSGWQDGATGGPRCWEPHILGYFGAVQVVVKLYQSLVERPPPAELHPERLAEGSRQQDLYKAVEVRLKDPDCKSGA